MKTYALEELLESARAGYWGGEAGSADMDVRIVRNGDVKPNVGVLWERLPLRALRNAEVEKSRLTSGDVLITTSGDCGVVALVREIPDEVTCASNFLRVLRFRREVIDPRFAFHYMQTELFRRSLSPYIRGTTMQNLSTRQAFPVVRLPVPSPELQQSYVERWIAVEELKSAASAIIDLAEELVHTLRVQAFEL